MKNAVAYYRVSTKKQGISGLGLDAQKETVKQYQTHFKLHIEREYIGIESGKRTDRKVLNKAIRYCKRTGAVLLFAKIDRLARNVLFVAMLIESKIEIKAADKPFATTLDLLEDAIRAEREGQAISQRTKAALQAAKKRGVLLGTHGKIRAQLNREASLEFALKMKPTISELNDKGYTSLQRLTDELNRRKIPTYRRGAKWHKSTVHKLLMQLNLKGRV